MTYSVIFEGGAIATLSRVERIVDSNGHDLMSGINLSVIFTIWGYDNLEAMNRILDDRGLVYSFQNINYDAGEFTYEVQITNKEQLIFIKDELKKINTDWTIKS